MEVKRLEGGMCWYVHVNEIDYQSKSINIEKYGYSDRLIRFFLTNFPVTKKIESNWYGKRDEDGTLKTRGFKTRKGMVTTWDTDTEKITKG